MNEGNSIRLEEFHQLTKQIRGSEQHLIVPLSSLDPEKCQKQGFDPQFIEANREHFHLISVF